MSDVEAARNTTQVGARVSELSQICQELEEIVGLFEERLVEVLREREPEASTNSKAEDQPVQLAQSLQAKIRSFLTSNSRLKSILDRLEL